MLSQPDTRSAQAPCTVSQVVDGARALATVMIFKFSNNRSPRADRDTRPMQRHGRHKL